MILSAISIYPIKSLKGIALSEAVVERRGLTHDRRWMLTTPSGVFFTQREYPKMATIKVEVTGNGLLVSAKEMTAITIPFEPDHSQKQDVTIWQSVCPGEVYDEDVNQWFSQVLGVDCQLVSMPDDSRRSVNQRFDHGQDIVSFADGYPLMVLSEASLADLNSRLETRLPMNRFRPNLVVSGSEAFAEDNWTRIRIGDTVFRSTKPCERCVVTTVDQAAGGFDGKEPLKTLASYRMAKTVFQERYESFGCGENAVLFGQNLIAENPGGVVTVGDKIEILDAV